MMMSGPVPRTTTLIRSELKGGSDAWPAGGAGAGEQAARVSAAPAANRSRFV
jgi:hypothetical protein